MTAPYSPPLLEAPIINPRVGGFIRPVPYLSASQYRYAPTAMDTDSLDTLANSTGSPTEQDQVQVLSNVIYRVSSWIDTYCFGVEETSKGASLCASQNVEDLWVLPMRGQFNLQCSYWPICQLDALAIGADPSIVQPVTQDVASRVRFGKRTIYVPITGFPFAGRGNTLVVSTRGPDGKVYCVWTYTNGFPHLQLAEVATEGTNTVDVVGNGPGSTLLGVYPGDALTIDDYSFLEPITVESISGTTITTVAPLQFTHTPPAAPDFTAVTALPGDVTQAAIFLATALIKSRGDLSLTLDGVGEPVAAKSVADDVWTDVKWGFGLLANYRAVSKQRS